MGIFCVSLKKLQPFSDKAICIANLWSCRKPHENDHPHMYHTWVVQTILKGRFIIGLAHYPGITWKPMHSLIQAYPDWFILASFQGRHAKKSLIYPQSHGWESVQFYFRDHFFSFGGWKQKTFFCAFLAMVNHRQIYHVINRQSFFGWFLVLLY